MRRQSSKADQKAGGGNWLWILWFGLSSRAGLPRPWPTCLCHRGRISEALPRTLQYSRSAKKIQSKIPQEFIPLPGCPRRCLGCPGGSTTLNVWPPAVSACRAGERTSPWRLHRYTIKLWSSIGEPTTSFVRHLNNIIHLFDPSLLAPPILHQSPEAKEGKKETDEKVEGQVRVPAEHWSDLGGLHLREAHCYTPTVTHRWLISLR